MNDLISKLNLYKEKKEFYPSISVDQLKRSMDNILRIGKGGAYLRIAESTKRP